MIEAKVEKRVCGICTELKVDGNLRDICKDAAWIIRGVYDGLLKSDPASAEYFRGYMSTATLSNLFWTLPRGNVESVMVDLSSPAEGGPV